MLLNADCRIDDEQFFKGRRRPPFLLLSTNPIGICMVECLGWEIEAAGPAPKARARQIKQPEALNQRAPFPVKSPGDWIA